MTPSDPPRLTPMLLGVLGLAAGLGVAGNYYNQALLAVVGHDLDVAQATVALMPFVTQSANALGLLFLAPLGDMTERKRLLVVMLTLLALALVSAGITPGFPALLASSVLIGLFATVTQQIIPLAVHLADPARGAQALGVITACIFTGILLSRAFAGFIAEAFGWRAVFLIAGVATAIVAVWLILALPRVRPSTRQGYVATIGSLGRIWREHSVLRRVTLIHGLVFAGFIGFWSTLALHLQGPEFGLGLSAVTWIALLGVIGVFVTPIVGHMVDRVGPQRVATGSLWFLGLSFLVLAIPGGGLLALVPGVILLDLAVQASQVANQSRALGIDPNARSRLNTLFMAGSIAGGAAGAAIAALAYATIGWSGTCLTGLLTASLALVIARREALQVSRDP